MTGNEQEATRGDFWKFVEDASKDKELKERFLKGLEQPGIGARGLLELLYKLGYRGVSLDECQEILAQIKNPKKLLEAWNGQY